MYQNYPIQKYGYGERQMSRMEYEAMNKGERRIKAVWFVLVAALIVALWCGLEMRGVL